MSEALTDDALDAAASAAIDAAAGAPVTDKRDEAAGGADPAPAEPKDPKSKLEATALTIGWSGKEAWKGDPADWLDAPEFILKAAGEVLPSMRKSLEKANDEIKGLKSAVKTSIGHITKARKEGYEQRSRELQSELATYAAAGDVENVKSVTADIVALEKEVTAEAAPEAPDEPAEFTAWKAENPWFGTDKAMTAACIALGNEVFDEGYTGKAQTKEVDRRLREQFPAKFAKPTNPNRALPGAVEGPGGARRGGSKSFSDMPRDAQEMCLDMIKASNGKITKESYAREHFAIEDQRK
jgi:hypothetical protein